MLYQETASTSLNNIKMNPPGPLKFPFFGTLPFLRKYLHLALNRLAKKYGNIFQIHVGGRKIVVLSGLETIKEALVKQQDSFNARADFDVFQQAPQREFLELKGGEPWRKHRNIVIQVMHTFMTGKSGMLESWVMEEAADLANFLINSSGQPLDPESYLPLATLSFMQRLMFSKRGSVEDSDFVTTAYGLKDIPNGLLNTVKLDILPTTLRPIFRIFYRKSLQAFPKGMGLLHSYVSKNVEQHRESFNPDNLRNITDGFLKASSELTESDRSDLHLSEKDIVIGSLIQFAGAGGELPSLMLRWALLYMIAYPDIQAKIHKELDEVVGTEQPSLSHRGKLPFTEACINEIFRHSSATVIPPITYATTTDTSLEGYFIPKNTPLLINYYGLTRDERIWEEPEQFNPYRFLGKNGKLRNELLDKFYPFGVGSRRCTGEYLGRLQIFIFFTSLLHKCKFEKAPGEKLNFESIPAPFVSPNDYKVVAKSRF